jgi:hypothetical protein
VGHDSAWLPGVLGCEALRWSDVGAGVGWGDTAIAPLVDLPAHRELQVISRSREPGCLSKSGPELQNSGARCSCLNCGSSGHSFRSDCGKDSTCQNFSPWTKCPQYSARRSRHCGIGARAVTARDPRGSAGACSTAEATWSDGLKMCLPTDSNKTPGKPIWYTVGRAIAISDPLKIPITAQKQSDGSVILRGHKAVIILSQAELDRLFAFARNRAVIQRYPAPQRPEPARGEYVHPAIGLDSPCGDERSTGCSC